VEKIYLQVYSVIDDMIAASMDTLERIAKIGYTGVEFAAIDDYKVSPKEIKKKIDSLGLMAVSNHGNVGEIEHEMELANILGYKNIVCPGIGEFNNRDQILEIAEFFNNVGETCSKNGFTFSFHNHYGEFKCDEVTGERLLDVLYDNTDPRYVNMQLDVCWATVAGVDPVSYLKKYQNRAKLVHMKEVLTLDPFLGTGIGSGIVDFNGIYKLLKDDVLYVVEQEGNIFTCDGKVIDVWDGLKSSYEYLRGLQL